MVKRKVVAMIPARLGSQRLVEKNLKKIGEKNLVEICIEKCQASGVFDEIWVNTESEKLGRIATEKGVRFYKRGLALSSNDATSEDFVYDFAKNIDCEYIVQVHTITPLLGADEISDFTRRFILSGANTGLSYEEINLECVHLDSPVNFTFQKKQNSQNLTPVKKIAWSITGWKPSAFRQGECNTYIDPIYYHRVRRESAIAIKTAEDLKICQKLYNHHKSIA